MARLIIGHTTSKSARIWVRGDKRNPAAFLLVSNGKSTRKSKKLLEERFGYTGVIEVGSLKPSTEYQCSVQFGQSMDEPEVTRVEYGHTDGKFTTFPVVTKSSRPTTKFMLGSCNLHTFGIFQNPDDVYRTLLQLSVSESIDFMIHAGDQIYYDVPNFLKLPYYEDYRKKYLNAWGDSRPTRKLLANLSHYMIMDDHELVNNFATDKKNIPSGASPGDIKKHALRVYREFQHIHNPNSYGNQALHYHFSHGKCKFFCLDTRSERVERQDSPKTMMIDSLQMSRFKKWLTTYKDDVKFVVTSVPFVGHVENNTDKWCSEAFKVQREEILKHMLEKNVTGVTFLTGDMHNSYHATMEVESDSRNLVVHELMSSPLNQTTKSSYGKYLSNHTVHSEFGFKYKSILQPSKFFNENSNVMIVKVVGRSVKFEVVRTRTGERRKLTGKFRV